MAKHTRDTDTQSEILKRSPDMRVNADVEFLRSYGHAAYGAISPKTGKLFWGRAIHEVDSAGESIIYNRDMEWRYVVDRFDVRDNSLFLRAHFDGSAYIAILGVRPRTIQGVGRYLKGRWCHLFGNNVGPFESDLILLQNNVLDDELIQLFGEPKVSRRDEQWAGILKDEQSDFMRFYWGVHNPDSDIRGATLAELWGEFEKWPELSLCLLRATIGDPHEDVVALAIRFAADLVAYGMRSGKSHIAWETCGVLADSHAAPLGVANEAVRRLVKIAAESALTASETFDLVRRFERALHHGSKEMSSSEAYGEIVSYVGDTVSCWVEVAEGLRVRSSCSIDSFGGVDLKPGMRFLCDITENGFQPLGILTEEQLDLAAQAAQDDFEEMQRRYAEDFGDLEE